MNQPATPVVDCHFHIFGAGTAAPYARYRPPYAATLAAWLQLAGALDDPFGVVVQTSFLGTDNTALLAALRAMPGRLRGVAVVDPDVSDEALRELDDAGVRGIRLNLYRDAGWRRIDTAPWRALFARIAALGWHVELHTDNGDGSMVLAALDIALDAALGEGDVPVVLDHFGRPGAAGVADPVFDVAAAVRQRRQVWVKCSAPYRLVAPQAWRELAQRWLEVAGADRLLWGSDWPWTNHESAERAGECSELSRWPGNAPADASPSAALRWRNAAALYGFEIAPAAAD
ncbi:hydrolase [Cupriavidus sp. TA19]|uniref:amidohydrolase family protein n=1 Tax=unclassified Cupriavidus TaxID=2640874 RepID=UPI000E2E620C|nr:MULTISPECIES: amidohydrolase family protein [unclassified Cupriavidus]BDB26340.1 amidohydrolase family protein [Cupriavidus sp. P-10]GLC92713.1 hydrolase [Cupriavidus sp. TA19]